ncbi:MAG: hypothetical protein JSW59_00940, partial [Phycisphaerales bacterium]
MSESITAEDKEQYPQKPPSSVGSRGNETGLFLTALGVGLLGLSVMVLLYPYICTAECVMLGIEKTVLWLLVFLAAPILA